MRVGDRYAYFVWRHGLFSELYDYRRDPRHTEMDNVSRDPQYALLDLGLSRLVKRLAHCRGAGCALTMDTRGNVGHLPSAVQPTGEPTATRGRSVTRTPPSGEKAGSPPIRTSEVG